MAYEIFTGAVPFMHDELVPLLVARRTPVCRRSSSGSSCACWRNRRPRATRAPGRYLGVNEALLKNALTPAACRICNGPSTPDSRVSFPSGHTTSASPRTGGPSFALSGRF